jgi:hypothetical protein
MKNKKLIKELKRNKEITRENFKESGGYDGRFSTKTIPNKKKTISKRKCRLSIKF